MNRSITHSLSESELIEQLRLRALWLSYPAFAHVAKRVLEDLGLYCVDLEGRHYFRGRTAHGGFDMEAIEITSAGNLRVLVQLKRYARPVHRRYIDELRGAQLRLASPGAVVITTSTFAKKAKEAAMAYPGRPNRLIDGKELGKLMFQARIGVGVSRDLATGKVQFYFDEPQFERLEAFCADVYRQPKGGRHD